MRKLTVPLSLLLVFLLLSGCTTPAAFTEFLTRFTSSETVDTQEGIFIWRAAAAPAEGGELVRAEPYPAQDPDPEAVLAAFCAPSGTDGLRCALPDGVLLEEHSLENGVMTLTLSPEYLALDEMDRTLTAFCAVLTLCQLEGIEAVTVLSDGQTVFAGLMAEDALLTAADADPYVRQLRLYFPDGEGRYLASEYHSLTLDEDTSPERYVIEELLRGPHNGELKSVMPAGTALLSCTTANGICTVDLSAAFLENRPRTPLGERLVLYAIVDSLTALSGVDSVRILVEGEAPDPYVCRSLSEPLSSYDEVIGPVSAPRGELDTDLYLALPGLEEITPLPFRISGEGYDSTAEAAIAALLSVQEPGYPAVFPGTTSVMDVSVQGTMCTVDLSESFFVSLPAEARETALQSIGATLCALPDVAAVRFTIGGGDAVFDGVDWSGPWREFNKILSE